MQIFIYEEIDTRGRKILNTLNGMIRIEGYFAEKIL